MGGTNTKTNMEMKGNLLELLSLSLVFDVTASVK